LRSKEKNLRAKKEGSVFLMRKFGALLFIFDLLWCEMPGFDVSIRFLRSQCDIKRHKYPFNNVFKTIGWWFFMPYWCSVGMLSALYL